MDNENLENQNVEITDEQATIQALNNTLEEYKSKIDELTKSVNDLKISNQQMALKINAEQVVTDEMLFKDFSKYK